MKKLLFLLILLARFGYAATPTPTSTPTPAPVYSYSSNVCCGQVFIEPSQFFADDRVSRPGTTPVTTGVYYAQAVGISTTALTFKAAATPALKAFADFTAPQDLNDGAAANGRFYALVHQPTPEGTSKFQMVVERQSVQNGVTNTSTITSTEMEIGPQAGSRIYRLPINGLDAMRYRRNDKVHIKVSRTDTTLTQNLELLGIEFDYKNNYGIFR